jgi:hypothetical protein
MSNALQRQLITGFMAALMACGAHAGETISYTYDSLGRLKSVRTNGGPADGSQRVYAYDAAGNRATLHVGPGVTISAKGTVANETSVGVVLGVNITGSPAPAGTVTFTENGTFLGSASVSSGQASVILEDFALGTHAITASYSGDAANAPYSVTFTIKVQNLNWLPAVLQILLSG